MSRALGIALPASNDSTRESTHELMEEVDVENTSENAEQGDPNPIVSCSDVSTSVDACDDRDTDDDSCDKSTDSILSCNVTSPSVEIPSDTQDQTDAKTLLEDVKQLFEGILSGCIQWTGACESESLKTLVSILDKAKHELEQSRTANVWFQYQDMASVLRDFIRSERTGDWKLHLRSLSRMLPYLAASGHHLYTKSLYIYLTQMLALPETHPHIYEHVFQRGLHVVRRSDRLWAGLSTDLVIEQVLMRSLKTSGGLTRGRGMDERQRLIWTLSNPVCAEYNSAIQELTEVGYATSDQHKDMCESRIQQDTADIQKMHSYLVEKSPFNEMSDL